MTQEGGFVPLYYAMTRVFFAIGRGFMICGFIVNAMGRGFEKNLISGLLRPAMAMTDCDLDGDPNIDSQNAPNSLFIPKNGRGF